MTKRQADMHAVNIRSAWPKKVGNKQKDIKQCSKCLMDGASLERFASFIAICKDIPRDNVKYVPALWKFCSPNYVLLDKNEWKEFINERREMYRRKNTRRSSERRDGSFNREGPATRSESERKNPRTRIKL